MNKNNESDRILESIVLENGLQVTFYDFSKKVAADRWLVKVECEAVYKVNDDFFSVIDDAEMASAMKRDCAESIRHLLSRERNFVEENDLEAVRQDLFDHLYENARRYMSGELFVQKLFEKKVEEFRSKYLVQKELERMTHDEDDDEGPADFSACFRD